MSIYKYKVRDKYGLLIKGRTSGDNMEEVSNSLRASNYTIISLGPISAFQERFLNWSNRFRRVSQKEILSFVRQLSSMIHAGLPILTCLRNIIEQSDNPNLKIILDQVYDDIEGGSSFSNAIGKHPRYFSKFFVSMINVGEISGRMDEVLERIVVISKQETELKAKVMSALTYPIVLVCLATCIIVFLLVKILPKFITVYKSMDVELPMVTKALLLLSSVLGNFWWLILLVMGALIILFRRYRATSQGRFNTDQMLLRVPAVGTLILKYNIARFARTFGALIKSGLAVLQGLAVIETTMTNQALATVIKDLRGSVLEGQTMSEQLKLSGIFPPMVTQMIAAGEQTGKLDDMLLDVADFYDIEVDYQIRTVTTLLEPVMLIGMGLMVLFIALAVLKPIFGMVQAFK